MYTKLTEMLHLQFEPIGIFFGNTTAKCDLDAAADKRNCVVPLLMASAKGKVISMDEESCNCPGGATGCCFGDGFSRLNPNIHIMLSQGAGENAPEGTPIMLKEGERFFCNEDIAMKWRKNMPFSDKAYPRIVFAPLSRWDEIGKPDLVFLLANPDQISALVTMLGFHNGKSLNTLAPYGAACHSILYAAEQMEKEEPYAIMGLFDISQRNAALENCLSLTMPYQLWEPLSVDLDKSCLTSHSWRKIEARLK
ncbi:DUF169 domain-containing protein [Extibacter muris]|uniref:DUF169 domain-containing protein n=1 Tax=Extibacter muris TaxID=1796622 RepID=UPI001D067D0F|nr:DUF169 domain-containing protein [Extibacter muris]MCB6203789.1 DUF169 domain-containing protein [Extibacter muris]MCQ4665457.1 DUF169 domain-containing protein [Extibacter muris]MCQ4695004.1 DUF169 domain-containing protein [Extibacter muris]